MGIISSIIAIILGIVLVIWPAVVAQSIVQILGILLIAAGVISLFSFLKSKSSLLLASIILEVLIGIVFLSAPVFILKYLFIVMGILLVAAGIGEIVRLVKMSYGGKADATYVWVDEYIGEPGEGTWTGGYWKNKVTGKKIGTGDEIDPFLRSGESYWMSAPDTTEFEDIESINLLFNGEVLQKSEAYPLAASGVPARKYGIGNMMPVNVGLTGITAAGYEDSFLIQVAAEAPTIEAVKLSYGGKADATYVWVDTYVGDPGEGAWTGGYWQNKVTGNALVPTGTTPGAGEETELVLKPGDGLWVSAPDTTEFEDLELITLTFPKTF